MHARKPIFPGIIELNFQSGEVIGCNVYLIYSGNEWVLVDIGYEENVDEFLEIIRDMDFPLSQCKGLIATHADVDHVQGLAKLKQALRSPVYAHTNAVTPLESGDKFVTLAEIPAQNLTLDMPAVKIDHVVDDGDVIQVGDI
ncbi:MAG: MBL fold metallo-hydrolase, partial [Planctomycetota bacterium]